MYAYSWQVYISIISTCRYVLYSISFSVPLWRSPMWGSALVTVSPSSWRTSLDKIMKTYVALAFVHGATLLIKLLKHLSRVSSIYLSTPWAAGCWGPKFSWTFLTNFSGSWNRPVGGGHCWEGGKFELLAMSWQEQLWIPVDHIPPLRCKGGDRGQTFLQKTWQH